MSLSERATARIDQIVASSGLVGDEAERLRFDLRLHLTEGLAAGRPEHELLRRLGPSSPQSARQVPYQHGRGRGAVGARGSSSRVADAVRAVRFGLRSLLRNRAVAATSITVLALGIAANVVVLTAIDELFLSPLPVESPERLVDVWADIEGGNGFSGFAWEDYLAYREGTDVLEEMAAFSGRRMTRGRDETETVIAQAVTPSYFSLLELSPLLGTLAPTTAPLSEPVVVLTHSFWRARMGSDPDIVGGTIVLDGQPVRVAGVGPDGFEGHFIGFPSDLWWVLTPDTPLPGMDLRDRAAKPLEIIGRLRDGASVEEAGTALNGLAAELEATYPEVNRGHRVGVSPTTGIDHSMRGPVAVFAGALFAVSAMVLLAACLNVGGILLARLLARKDELAVRTALGAGRGHLLGLVLTEILVLLAAGSLVGTLLSGWLTGLLARSVRSLSGGLGLELQVDPGVVLIAIGLACAVALVATALPAFRLVRRIPAGSFRRRGGSSPGARTRSALVVGQVTVSVVLTLATGLFLRALYSGAQARPGFDPAVVATVAVDMVELGRDGSEREVALRTLLDGIESIPGVESVSLSDGPVVGLARMPAEIEVSGHTPPPGQDRIVYDRRVVGARYFETVGIPLLAGRGIGVQDHEGEERAAVVNEAFVRRFWPGSDPIGQSFSVDGQPARVVGVSADALYVAQDATPDPLVYLARGPGGMASQIVVRSSDPAPLATPLAEVVTPALARPSAFRFTPLSVVLEGARLPQRVAVTVIGVMGLVAILLAGVGLYGLVQYSVTRDMRELGVRVALGCSKTDLVAVVLRRGGVLVALGVLLGGALTAAVVPRLSGLLAGVSPFDPPTWVAVVATFTAIGVLASGVPALRALALSPAEILREN